MNDERAHVRLRMGQLEVEYEGDASFLKSELVGLVRELAKLSDAEQVPLSTEPPAPPADDPGTKSTVDMSMLSVATALNANSGPDLAIAAAVFLTICQGTEVFSRKEILDNMRAAPAYFKQAMSSNLSGTLQSLLKQKRLNQTAGDQYALAIKERERLHAILTNGS